MADHRFVNQGFIDAWNEIADQDIDKCIKLGLMRKGLLRLPQNIGNLKKLRALHLGTNQLKSPPESFGNLL